MAKDDFLSVLIGTFMTHYRSLFVHRAPPMIDASSKKMIDAKSKLYKLKLKVYTINIKVSTINLNYRS